ncbi:MAG: NUDIX domain-containing protein [Candidatus Hodarchaeales archaeon]
MLPKMIHAVDGILVDSEGEIILIQRKSDTFDGYWALPGGIVEVTETVEEALEREMREETGVIVKPKEILGVFSHPDRDPRGRVITTVFICEYQGVKKAGSDAGSIKTCSIVEALSLDLAFDHHSILNAYKIWCKERGTFWSKKPG